MFNFIIDLFFALVFFAIGAFTSEEIHGIATEKSIFPALMRWERNKQKDLKPMFFWKTWKKEARKMPYKARKKK